MKSSEDEQSPDEKKSVEGVRGRLREVFKGGVRWSAYMVHGRKAKKSSKSIARNHVIEVAPSGLVSLMGGKWTSYRV